MLEKETVVQPDEVVIVSRDKKGKYHIRVEKKSPTLKTEQPETRSNQ